jgi:hypothetical protein
MAENRATSDFPFDMRIARSDGVIAAEVAGEVVILSVESGYFHQLNPMGSYIWNLLEHPMVLSELCLCLMDEFEIDSGTCRRDVTAFLQAMEANGILVLADLAAAQ